MSCRSLPRSRPGASRDAQDGPRRRQERPKTAPRRPQEPPRAAQEPPRGGLRTALVATWGPPGAQEAPGGLRGGILAPRGSLWAPPGLHFRSFQSVLRSLAGSKRKRKRKRSCKRKAQAQGQEPRTAGSKGRRASRTRGPGGMCGPLAVRACLKWFLRAARIPPNLPS